MAIWREDVRDSLIELGGEAPLSLIYDAVRKIRGCPPPKSWQAIVRRELEYNSSDSESYLGKHDLFFSVEGLGKGIWGLRVIGKKETASSVSPRKRKVERKKIKSEGHLQDWEVAIIKTLLEAGEYNDQQILAFFTRPSRTVNHARILEIRKGIKRKSIPPASEEDLNGFLEHWPNLDRETGAHVVDDELILKAREAILFAVQAYNSPRMIFKAEITIVSIIIGWTYLLHAYYLANGVNYKCYLKKGNKRTELTTRYGATKYWGLAECIAFRDCPLEEGAKNNLKLLIRLRDEIEHRMTRRIDASIASELFASCVNFNRTLKSNFGERFALDKDLSFALQFSEFSEDQIMGAIQFNELPANALQMKRDFEQGLTDSEFHDPAYALRFAFVPMIGNRLGRSDRAIQFVKGDPKTLEELERLFLKEVEKPKLKPKQIVDMMKAEGFEGFSMLFFIKLWQSIGAKDPAKNWGVYLKDKDWWWYETFVERVREHCLEKGDLYR